MLTVSKKLGALPWVIAIVTLPCGRAARPVWARGPRRMVPRRCFRPIRLTPPARGQADTRSGRAVPRVAQDAARVVTGVRALLEEHLTVHDRVVDSLGQLPHPPAVVR